VHLVVVVGGWYGLAILQGMGVLSPNHREKRQQRRLGPLSTLSLVCAGIFLQPRSRSFFALSSPSFCSTGAGNCQPAGYYFRWFGLSFCVFSVNLGKRGILLPLYPALRSCSAHGGKIWSKTVPG
jgi:hypothetical protein